MADGTKDADTAQRDPLAGVRWIHGSPPGGPADPNVQVVRADDDTFIMRQSKDLNYEAPFLYLLCGAERAILLDTGAVAGGGVRETVDSLLRDRERDTPGYHLVVAHTHGHGDHVAGDGDFAGRPDTTVVGRELGDVQAYFGFTSWPAQVLAFDLGGRRLEITGSPGHQDAAITVYDERTGFLLTGDTVYPGRLYVRDMAAFTASLDRLAEFTATRRVSHVLGCHIEMTTQPDRDYPIGCRYQSDEPPLQLSPGRLLAVRDAARQVKDQPGVHKFGDFAIYNGPCVPAVLRQIARGLAGRGRRKVTLLLRMRSGRRTRTLPWPG
jgi:hydroxyacylglutathione hydrolase